jgi:DNA-binding transcriptional ArsR family regulator
MLEDSAIHALIAPAGMLPAPPGRPASRRGEITERFLKGPVSLNWLAGAGRLPGKALHAATTLVYLSGLRKSTTVAMSPKAAREFGLSRYALYRALDALERAGLIKCQRRPGKAAVVELIGAAPLTSGATGT